MNSRLLVVDKTIAVIAAIVFPNRPLPGSQFFPLWYWDRIKYSSSYSRYSILILYPMATVTIDTTCLCNPAVKIDFSSIINYQALLTLGVLPVTNHSIHSNFPIE